jgi:hypothetical protein
LSEITERRFQKEERKYQTNDEVWVAIKPSRQRGECQIAGLYRGVLAHYFIQDGHRTLEVCLVEDILKEEQTHLRLTVTKWRRTQGRYDEGPFIWVDEYLEGWF